VPEHDRDQAVERILERVMQEDGDSAPAAVCLDGETIAAWTEGALHRNEAAMVERHVAGCPRCRALMAALVETAPAAAVPGSMWRQWRLAWVVPLATAATAAALWIAVPGTRPAGVRDVSETAATPAAPAAATPPAPQESFAFQNAAPPEIPLREKSPETRENEQQARDSSAQVRPDAAAETAIARRIEADSRERTRNAAPQGSAASQRLLAASETVAPDGSTRWRIIGGQRLEKSTAGADWQAVALPAAGSIAAAAAPSTMVCWIVGTGGSVYLTIDGTSFARLPFPERVDLDAVTAIDDRTATVSAADGRSWRTSDGGMTWTLIR